MQKHLGLFSSSMNIPYLLVCTLSVMKWPSLIMLRFFALKCVLSDTAIAWYIFFHSFAFNLFVFIFKWVSFREESWILFFYPVWQSLPFIWECLDHLHLLWLLIMFSLKSTIFILFSVCPICSLSLSLVFCHILD